MARVLLIAGHRPNRSPSQRYRFEPYMPFFREHGFECDLSYLVTEEEDRFFYLPGHFGRKAAATLRHLTIRLGDLLRARNYDLIFIHREAFFLGPALFEALLARTGPPVIFDLDDAIWLPNVSEGNRALAWMKYPGKVASIVRRADLVIAGNEYLADYCRDLNDEVHVIPTTVDTGVYRPRPAASAGPDAPVVIGWSGSPTTTPHFRAAVPTLERVAARFGDRVRFKVIGDGDFTEPRLGIRGVPWTAETELFHLHELDIGIMPLPDTEWARGKCGLKALVYMAVGIPAVVSAVGVNPEIVTDGVDGFLASNPEEWEQAISALVESPERRSRIGAAGRQRVIDAYSVAANRERYLTAFTTALARR